MGEGDKGGGKVTGERKSKRGEKEKRITVKRREDNEDKKEKGGGEKRGKRDRKKRKKTREKREKNTLLCLEKHPAFD